MRTVAGRLTDEQMRAVSQYVASMPVATSGR
jgi:cytochrome c553